MNPKEIIAQLSLLRVPMTERTLYNYSTWKLIPEPKRGSGRSGKWVEYPQEAMGEAYAAWKLLHGDYIQSYFVGESLDEDVREYDRLVAKEWDRVTRGGGDGCATVTVERIAPDLNPSGA